MDSHIYSQQCRVCKIIKEINIYNFSKSTTYKNGFSNRCRNCENEYLRNRYKENIKEIRNKENERKRRYKEETKERLRASARKWSKTPSGIFKAYRRRRRKVKFLLTKEEFINLIDKPCQYCGENARGIDRVDNHKDYSLDNSVSCCGRCNKMKMDMTVEEFINRCTKIIKNNIPWPSKDPNDIAPIK